MEKRYIKSFKLFESSVNESFKELLITGALALGLITTNVNASELDLSTDPVSYCKSKFSNENLEKAKEYWKNWLNNPVTIEKLSKIHKTTKEDIKANYIPKWLELIKPITLKYEEMSDQTIAEVSRNPSDKNIYVNLKSDVFNPNFRKKYEMEPITTLVHELQHKMSSLIPINPNEVVKASLGNAIQSTSGLFKTKFDESVIKRVAGEFGITDPHMLDTIKKRVYAYYGLNRGANGAYAKLPTEIVSRIEGLRYKYGIKPGQAGGLTPEMFKDTFLGIKQDFDKDWILVIWAKQGYPPLKEFLNGLDQLALTGVKQNDQA